MLLVSPTLVHMTRHKNYFIIQCYVIELAHFVLF